MVANTRLWYAGLICLAMLLALSCGGGGNPIAPLPDGSGDVPGLTGGNDPGGLTPGHDGQAAGSSASLWGVWDLTYDEGSGTFEIVPMRTSQYTFNMTGFLQPPDGNLNNLSVSIVDKTEIAQGRLKIDVSIKHPVPVAKIVGFDTYGTLVGNGTLEFDEDDNAVFAGTNELKLLNADGYTRWMNPTEFSTEGLTGFIPGALGTPGSDWTATINGYKYFADGLTATGDLAEYLSSAMGQSKRGAFMPETTNTRQYYIQFPMNPGPSIKFQYAVISHFRGAKDENGDPITEPEISDFPPDANSPEAFYLKGDTSQSNLFWNQPQQFGGGDLVLELEVFDWQGMESLGGTGVKDQVVSIGLGSPEGWFGPTGLNLPISSASITETATANPQSTILNIEVEDLTPAKEGIYEIIVAVYSADPTQYKPPTGMGSAWPIGASLAAYGRFEVEVVLDNIPGNHAPVIEEIQGPTEVSCWNTAEVYTCIADDVDPGDTLTYKWEVTIEAMIPLFLGPSSPDNTATIDWSSSEYFAGNLSMWFQVSDGTEKVQKNLPVVKLLDKIILDPIEADPDDILDVTCLNSDAEYSVAAANCGAPAVFSYRWLRGEGTPPPHPDPSNPDWTLPSADSFILYDWAYTSIGTWWIIAEAGSGMIGKEYSAPLFIERIDTPPSDIEPPTGETEVDCNNNAEIYQLLGGGDCDGGENTRQWAITPTSTPPTVGWLQAVDNKFTVNWAIYPVGTYYAWQRIGGPSGWSVSDPLQIHRNNTPPDEPDVPSGPVVVTCANTAAVYNAGTVDDCEDDTLDREWALGTGPAPPASGWVSFTGNTFVIDFSGVENGLYGVFQRVSDGGSGWSYSLPAQANKVNSAPDAPDTVSGDQAVTCYDTAVEYQAGVASDCDAGDMLTRSYLLSVDSEFPIGDWVDFTGDSFFVDWSEYMSIPWYIFQRTSDEIEQTPCDVPLEVIKTNALPEVDPPTGPTTVDCTSINAEYTEGAIFDCDPNTDLIKQYYVSTDPNEQVGGAWIPYVGTSFFVDFAHKATDEYYIFLSANDGMGETISDSLHVTRVNTVPEKPQVLEGPAEVDCAQNPAAYSGGDVVDCDLLDTHTWSYYISTNQTTPTGGEWVESLGSTHFVDFDGVTAEQTYWLFQKVSDGFSEAVSDSLEVFYSNTAPVEPAPPSGDPAVSCANDNEVYQGGEAFDCDDWQTLTRSWAISTLDYPPATGWSVFPVSSWVVDWSLYDQDTYYMFQRVYDGFNYSYSESFQVTVGPPALITPPTPVGNEDPICDGMVETYDADTYMDGCSGVTITRSWAINDFPTPPGSGWTVFAGTTFDIDPTTLDIGDLYVFQRAQLDAQTEISVPLLITIHPGALGTPPTPSGAVLVDCSSDSEDYDMGTVTTACVGTEVDRSWQVQETDGTPVSIWIPFAGSTATVDWTLYNAGITYHLVQKASDGDHETFSSPLVVGSTNSDPVFTGSLVGSESVTCTDDHTLYDGGLIDDCDTGQTITREWSWNTVDSYPVSGWTAFIGSTFFVDYSSPEFQPGNIYLFQRASDGQTTVYDPASLHVVYNNSAPDEPPVLSGEHNIFCTNLVETYNAGEVSDCNGQSLTRQWVATTEPTPPASGWTTFTGQTIEIDWSSYGYGVYFLFQRVSDGSATTNSGPSITLKNNTLPEIADFTCSDGSGPFVTDGSTTSLAGLSMKTSLTFTASISDCDGETPVKYWAVTTQPVPPGQGDGAWTVFPGSGFTVNLADFTSLAPARLYVHVGVSDGIGFATETWVGTLTMWQKVWLTRFSVVGDMWQENACQSGVGTYNWNYDAGNGFLRLDQYSAASMSAVFGPEFTLPAAPASGNTGRVMAYVNPSLASGLDNVFFSLLRESGCNKFNLDIVNGDGCSVNSPELMQFEISNIETVWGSNRRLGIYQNGFTGCGSSNFYIDWAGFWVQPL